MSNSRVRRRNRTWYKNNHIYLEVDAQLRHCFREGLKKGLITCKDGLYCYDNIVLGTNEDAVVCWLKSSKESSKVVTELVKNTFQGECASDNSINV